MRNVAYIFGIVGLILQCSEALSNEKICNFWSDCEICLSSNRNCTWCAVDFNGKRLNVGKCTAKTQCPISEIIMSHNPSPSDSFTTIPLLNEPILCEAHSNHVYRTTRRNHSCDVCQSKWDQWCKITDKADESKIGYLCANQCRHLINNENVKAQAVTCEETCEVQTNCHDCKGHHDCSWYDVLFEEDDVHVARCMHRRESRYDVLSSMKSSATDVQIYDKDNNCENTHPIQVFSIAGDCRSCKASAGFKWCKISKPDFTRLPQYVCTSNCADFADTYQSITSSEVDEDCETMCNSELNSANCNAIPGCTWCTASWFANQRIPFGICTANSCLETLSDLSISAQSFSFVDDKCSLDENYSSQVLCPNAGT